MLEEEEEGKLLMMMMRCAREGRRVKKEGGIGREKNKRKKIT